MAKAALHFGKSSTFGSAEGRENQRRWTKEDYDRHNKYERFWYDITRAHLNFEVDSNFKPQPCGTSDPPDFITFLRHHVAQNENQ